MKNDNKMIDQSPLAESVSNGIRYEFMDYFLVKPLDPVKVTKTFEKPKTDNKAVTDANGIEAVDFDEVETETKEVNSDFRKAIVLKIPNNFLSDERVKDTIKVGDVIVFSDRAGRNFDLLKDSRLVRYYDVIAIER